MNDMNDSNNNKDSSIMIDTNSISVDDKLIEELNKLSHKELITKVILLEKEKMNLLLEKEKHRNLLIDLNINLASLQNNLKLQVLKYSNTIPLQIKDKLSKYTKNLYVKEFLELNFPKVTHIDILHWIELSAKSRNIDPLVIVESISIKKRQLIAVIITFLLLPSSLFFSFLWFYLAIKYDKYHIIKTILILYLIHIYYDKSHEKGAKTLRWLKQISFWKFLCNYFPILVVKQNSSTIYDPNEIYMFGYHPHGIISVGCFASFAADATGVSDMFPGINIYPATLNSNFYIPFWRELLLRLGVISVSATSLHYVLNKGPGSAALVVPGGAAEALDARPGTHSLTLNRRQGFFRIALQHGACLVPIYSFGENDLYEQIPNDEGSIVRKFQNIFLKYVGFATPFFSGAGLVGTNIPLNPIPGRVPVVTVIGDPIKCPKIEQPTNEDIDLVRVKYIERLHEIFNKFADQYAPTRSSDLEIIK